MTHAGPLVRVRDAAVGHDGVPLVRGIDLDIHAGELWVVLGPNGAGKSTFLQTVLGLLPPVSGAVALDPVLAPRARVGFVPQRCDVPATVPTTVREFVLLGTVGTRATAAERRERLAWALAHAGLAGLERHDFATLSGGQRQRALVARALVRRPVLLVLDEPATHLDPEAERRLFDLLGRLRAVDGIALVMVMHDVATALEVATHLAVFRDGRVLAGQRDAIAARLERGGRS
jgi:ABC-type Mn2+/Zn2+ transport system ATPase subunit